MIKKRPPLPAKKREAVAAMFAAGESAAAISKALDVNYEAVRSLIRRLSGIDRARRLNDGYGYGPHLKFDPKAGEGLTYRYEDDPRADKRSPFDWRCGWLERRSQARGEYDWGLNPVMPGR
jgi:hypothetical protein